MFEHIIDKFLLSRPFTNGNGVKTHAARELNAEMAKATDTLHRDKIARMKSGISQCIECGNPGAE